LELALVPVAIQVAAAIPAVGVVPPAAVAGTQAVAARQVAAAPDLAPADLADKETAAGLSVRVAPEMKAVRASLELLRMRQFQPRKTQSFEPISATLT